MDFKKLKTTMLHGKCAPWGASPSRIVYRLCLLIIALTSINCAKIGHPSGGPKDVAAPVMLDCSPKMYTTNFSEKKIILNFDEYVQINSLATVFNVSPPLKEKPEFKLKGKSVIIELNNELRENTTYTLNFGNGIADLNENNALQDFQYVFSTGKSIDSLQISGKVTDAFTNALSEGVQVMLYENEADSSPIKEIPLYAVKTDKNGVFSLKNLKKGKYKIFALKDGNSNLKFDQANEKIAFLDTLLSPDVSETEKTDTLKRKDKPDSLITNKQVQYSPQNIFLRMFEEDSKKLYLSNSDRPEKNKCVFVFSRPQPEEVKLKPLNFSSPAKWYVLEKNKRNDTLICWVTDTNISKKDTLKITLKYIRTDSTGALKPYTDTLNLRMKMVVSLKKNIPEKNNLKAKLNISSNSTLDLNQPVKLEFASPVANFDTSKIKLFLQKDSIGILQKYAIIPDSFYVKQIEKYLRFYILKFKWNEGSAYKINILPGAFTDIYGRLNDTLDIPFKIQKSDYYGTVFMKIKNTTEPAIVQLLDGKETVLEERQVENDQTLTYKFLKPLKYKMKIISDPNKNKQWDTGKYLKKLQPEKVLYFPGEINVRSNWDMELEWDVSQ